MRKTTHLVERCAERGLPTRATIRAAEASPIRVKQHDGSVWVYSPVVVGGRTRWVCVVERDGVAVTAWPRK